MFQNKLFLMTKCQLFAPRLSKFSFIQRNFATISPSMPIFNFLQYTSGQSKTLQADKIPKPKPTSPAEDALNENFDPDIVVNQDDEFSDGLESGDEYLFTESDESDDELPGKKGC
jgi:hypothetical protein